MCGSVKLALLERLYAKLCLMYALCTLTCLRWEQVLLQFETDVTRLLLSWASPSSCWMLQRSELCFSSVWLSVSSLYACNRKALRAYIK